MNRRNVMDGRGFFIRTGLVLCLTAGLLPAAVAAPARHPVLPAHAVVAPAEVAKTVSGIIKGQPVGGKYTVVSGKKTTEVDASKAVVRSRGRFAGRADLAPGSFIRAVGSMNGSTFVAKTVDIVRPAGGKRKKK